MKTIIIAMSLFLSSVAIACEPTRSGAFGDTPLHSATRVGDVPKARSIILNTHDPRTLCAKNSQGVSAFRLATALYYTHESPQDRPFQDIRTILNQFNAGVACGH